MKESFIEIKKSKFYGYYYKVNNTEEVDKILLDIKNNNKKCKHICYAYKIGVIEKRHEDKEPSGTSGYQLLNVINIKKDDNVLIVVVRYFGGTLLGTGTLSKTYRNVALDLYK